MKLKRFTLRGLITLAVMVAVCMFFSRTVQSITTPKVQLITAEKGRFEEKLNCTAQVYFAETETISADDPYGMAAAQCHVQPGDFVQTAAPVFTQTLPGYGTQRTALQAEYREISAQLAVLDATNHGLPREAPQQELYDAMLTASVALDDAIYAARLSAMQNGVILPANAGAWEKAAVPEQVKTAQRAYDEACAAYHDYIAANPGSEEILDYINARKALLTDRETITEQLLALDIAMTRENTIAAPHSGYILAVDAENLSYTLSGEGCEPVLRCLVPGHTIAEGTRADVITDVFGTERSTVIGMTGSFLHIAFPEELRASLSSLLDTGAQISITNRAKQATTLLPVSALRGSSEAQYVYQIEYVYGGILSTRSMKVVKVPVTVIARSSKAVSIAEDLEGKQIAVREDRMLTDGQTVMLYVN